MVFCAKCGAQNEDAASVCSKCGAALQPSRVERKRVRSARRVEDECFGLPRGGTIVGILIGVIILLVGLSWVPGLIPANIRDITDPIFWPAVVVVIGVLMIAGALYGLSRRR